MRKVFAFALVVAVMFAGISFADDGEKMKVDDVTFGKAYKIKGYAVITFNEFSFVDVVVQQHTQNVESGNEADIALLKADIRNLQKKDANFLGSISVQAVYDDEYEYNGLAGQFNYNRSKSEFAPDFSIGPMYTGHYGFFCKIPNYPVQDKTAPLRMTITIDGHEFTYHIRK